MQAAQRVVAKLAVQPTQGNGVGSGIGEQRPHRGQLAVGLAQSTQGFHTSDTAGGGIDERL
ncbi:hypothetical protein D3C81_2285630 [compost metagenome]